MPHITPTEARARALLTRNREGPVFMLNLLRVRTFADDRHAPGRAPAKPVTGREAYARYEAGITPLLEASGGEVLFSGAGGAWFIGPDSERWDHALLARQASVAGFLAFAQDPRARELGHHRTAALADSRLLPLAESQAENT
ncbi:MAG TPA: DUF1330 domain-containing protein [Rhodobacteraceae bacterium]|nr:DUF1330 domain-containing protein [Paracoccaceae bacterium]